MIILKLIIIFASIYGLKQLFKDGQKDGLMGGVQIFVAIVLGLLSVVWFLKIMFWILIVVSV